MTVDFDRAWLALKETIVAKKSHGQRDLLKRMTEIELECRIEDPSPSDLRKATTESPNGSAGMPDQTTPLTEGANGYGRHANSTSSTPTEALSGAARA